MTKIIDAHIHLFPDKLMLAILNWFEENYSWSMPFKCGALEHLEYLKKIGIDAIFLLGYVHRAGMSENINNWINDLAEKDEKIFAFAAVHQDDEKKADLLKNYLSKPHFKGVKIHSFVQKVSVADMRFQEVFRLLSDTNKSLVLHASSMPAKCPYTIPKDVENILVAYPNLRVMVAHLGLPDFMNEYLQMLHKYKNLYLDTAYVFGNPKFDTAHLRAVIAEHPDQIVYGSDFPIMDYPPEKAIEEIKSFNLGKEIEHKIFYENAKRFIGE